LSLCLILFEKGAFTSFFKDKIHKKTTKQYKSRFFIIFWLVDGAFTSFFKDKSHKKPQNSINQDFSAFFAC
jgi:hypothetical protein